MSNKDITLTVYGAEEICPSCVGAPGSVETYEWLQAAISRKYVNNSINYEYIDINKPQKVEKHKNFVERVFEEDLFYPVVLINDELVAEGVPRLKPIYEALEKKGLVTGS